MESATQLVRRMELDRRTVVVLTGAACAALLVFRRVSVYRDAKKKIQRAKVRRAENLQQAQKAVQQYKEAHPGCSGDAILALSLTELTTQLQQGSLNPEDVLYAYMEKTLDVNSKLNCCTVILLDSFDQLKSTNKEGLLYGVPVSIKDNYGYKNYDSSCGLFINLEKPVQEDCVIVQVLKKQGAIPFVKTNIPQGLLSYDCSNPIYGQTLNPHNLQKTSGGSSGGEGALIGGGGSLLGMGSDIGGSNRPPASFCGIYGFKPTPRRLSEKGVRSSTKGQKSVLVSLGPMARDLDSLVVCMRALLCDYMFSLDPTVPPLPFNEQMYKSSKPLRIGYLENDGYMQPSPSMARAVREVKVLLEQAGHTLVPYTPLKMSYAFTELVGKGLLGDGATTLLQNMEGGPLDAILKHQLIFRHVPKRLRKITSFLRTPLSPRLNAIGESTAGCGSISNLWKHHGAVQDYIDETIAEWKRCNIDVLLCPVIGPGFNLLYCGKITPVLSYTSIYNLLTFPAGVVPVSSVTREDEEELKNYKGFDQDQADIYFKQAVSGAEGLPVSVQCVSLPWQDELCLRFMKEVDNLVQHSRK
ncbi:fatty-acid amide hydrolase 1 [Cynoglossus semilaevis]|uniref:Fatty-acid amide hydrolase 1 n=1 Tax=Cynoglossus semilaevis TaxID=244447 RepID=A0A3P8WX10_CYNSE|nr:fatty-acid amide hydrolase 1 [Cynoglossus semilaevis]